MGRGVAVEDVTALMRVARAASDPLAPAARAEQVLAELQGLVPYVCAQLTRWDPHEQSHATLASHGYADPLLEHLSGPRCEAELTQLGMRRTCHPMRMRAGRLDAGRGGGARRARGARAAGLRRSLSAAMRE